MAVKQLNTKHMFTGKPFPGKNEGDVLRMRIELRHNVAFSYSKWKRLTYVILILFCSSYKL